MRPWHCWVPYGYAKNALWWVVNQWTQYQILKQEKKSWLSEDSASLLDLDAPTFSGIMPLCMRLPSARLQV